MLNFRSEADDPSNGKPSEAHPRLVQIPFQQYTADHQSDGNASSHDNSDDDITDDDDDLDLETDCNCDHNKNETCPVCVRVQSPEVYRLDFTGDHSGDSGSFNGEPGRTDVREGSKDGCESTGTSDNIPDNKTITEVQGSDSNVSDAEQTAEISDDKVRSDSNASGETIPPNPKIVISDSETSKHKSKEPDSDIIKNSTEDKRSKDAMKKDTKPLRRKERTPKHAKRRGRISNEGGEGDLKQEEKVEEVKEDLTKTDR